MNYTDYTCSNRIVKQLKPSSRNKSRTNKIGPCPSYQKWGEISINFRVSKDWNKDATSTSGEPGGHAQGKSAPYLVLLHGHGRALAAVEAWILKHCHTAHQKTASSKTSPQCVRVSIPINSATINLAQSWIANTKMQNQAMSPTSFGGFTHRNDQVFQPFFCIHRWLSTWRRFRLPFYLPGLLLHFGGQLCHSLSLLRR